MAVKTLLFGDWETRVGDFEAFATEVKLTVSPGMMAREADGQWKMVPHSWSDPVGEQGAEDPVAGVTFDEAKRFCEWLTRKSLEKEYIPRGTKFRLPTSKEWSLATGLLDEPKEGAASADGSAAIYPWGAEWPPPLTAGELS